jgi:Fe-S cluster assembly scaffold protein SufB
LPEYYWQAVDKDKDEFTRAAAENIHGGYFIRTEKGARVEEPVQSCLYIKGQGIGQNVHNIVVVEEDSELHIITGCATSHEVSSALHLGISEFYIKKGGRLTFTMVHNWGEEVVVRPRTVGIVEEDGVFANNYILLRPVKSVQSYPAVYLNGRGGVARFNSIIVAPEGSHVNSGNKIVLNAPDTRGEIISRTITTGGEIIAPGMIEGNAVPARGHLECKGLILSDGVIHAIPELKGTVTGVDLSHEAAVGKIAQEEIEYLMARGMDEDEATSTIVRGFLNVDIMGLPQELQESIEKTIEENEKEMF